MVFLFPIEFAIVLLLPYASVQLQQIILESQVSVLFQSGQDYFVENFERGWALMKRYNERSSCGFPAFDWEVIYF